MVGFKDLLARERKKPIEITSPGLIYSAEWSDANGKALQIRSTPQVLRFHRPHGWSFGNSSARKEAGPLHGGEGRGNNGSRWTPYAHGTHMRPLPWDGKRVSPRRPRSFGRCGTTVRRPPRNNGLLRDAFMTKNLKKKNRTSRRSFFLSPGGGQFCWRRRCWRDK